jgi:hypothetical protein
MSEGNEVLSRATLDAYADGELPPAEMSRIAALIERRADLRAYVESQERLRHHLQTSFEPVMNEPIPERLEQLIHSAVRKGPTRPSILKERLREFFTWNVIGPAAATLAVGLFVGLAVERFVPEAAPFVRSTQSGQILAQGELAHALDDQLAANASPNEVVRVGLSFRSKQGRDCRTFEWTAASVSTSGVACHATGGWHLAALVTQPRHANDAAAYQTAGAGMPDAIRSTVSAMISGEPFDPADERAARAAQWAGGNSK